MSQQIEIIKSLLEEVLQKLAIEGRVDFIEDQHPRFAITTEEAGLLIGEEGRHLIALNHIIKRIAENKLKNDPQEKIIFFLDVNDYQIKKMEELKNTARISAERARFFKREIEMDPMSSYDRRIVHSVLNEYLDMKTESVGEEPNRRIVIKPAN
jgi:spoIIIJ-associated protein